MGVGAYGSTDFTKLGWKDIYSCNDNNNMQVYNDNMAKSQVWNTVGQLGGIAIGMLLSGAFKTGKGGNETKTEVDPNAALNEQIKAQENVVTELKTKITEQEAKYNEAVKAVDDAHKEVTQRINTETENVNKAQKAKQDYDNNQTKITNITNKINELKGKKVSITASMTPEQKTEAQNKNAEIERQITQLEQEKQKLEETNNTLKKEADKLPEAQKTLEQAKADRQNLLDCDKKVQAEKSNLEALKSELSGEEQKLENLKKQKDMSSNINGVDGFGLSRLVDGKNSIKDQLAAFRKASDKFTNNPSSLTEDDIKALQNAENLADTIDKGNNQSESMKQVSSQLRAWAATHGSDIERFTNITSGNASADDIKNSGSYFEKQDRVVNGKKHTIYNGKGSNDSYYIDDKGQAHHLTYTQKGNLFQKAQYSYKEQ